MGHEERVLKMRNNCKFWLGNLKEVGHWEDLIIILKLLYYQQHELLLINMDLKEIVLGVWIEFTWLMISRCVRR